MRCVFCHQEEISTIPNGKKRIHGDETVKGQPVTAMLCGRCSVTFAAQGFQDIPWGGKAELEERIRSRIRTQKERKRLNGSN